MRSEESRCLECRQGSLQMLLEAALSRNEILRGCTSSRGKSRLIKVAGKFLNYERVRGHCNRGCARIMKHN